MRQVPHSQNYALLPDRARLIELEPCLQAAPVSSKFNPARMRWGMVLLRRRSLALPCDLAVGPAVAVEDGRAAAELLPPPDDHVAVLRVELDQARLASGFLTGDQR